MSLTVGESIAVATVLDALGLIDPQFRMSQPPTEKDVLEAARTLAAGASKRMQMTYTVKGKPKLRVRS